jgi:hypothetical protein
VRDTLSTICKYEGDLRKAEKELDSFVKRQDAEQTAGDEEGAPATDADKRRLH